MNSFLNPVNHSIASKWLRFANYLIDLILFRILITIIIMIIVELFRERNYLVVSLDQDPLMNRLFSIASYIIYALIMCLQEIIFDGRSIGKFITGTMVVMETGETPNTRNYLIRNLCRIIPFEQFSFFWKTGWHDSISKTRVVVKKEFEQNQAKFNSIDEIGKSEINNIT